MLEHTIDWVQTAGTVVEAVVFLRILSLKLQRVYTFITLYWAVNLMFDTAAWYFGWHSRVTTRIATNELYALAFLFPLTAWDAFEEFLPAIAKVRRLYLPRMFSGLLFTLILGCILALGVDDQNGDSGPAEFLGLFLWLGSAMSALLFTWNVFRSARSQSLILPGNTFVWSVFFLVTLTRAVLDFAFSMVGSFIGQQGLGVTQLLLLCVDIAISLWCILRLRSSPSDLKPAPEQASL